MANKLEKKLLIGFGAFFSSFAGLILISFAVIALVALAIASIL